MNLSAPFIQRPVATTLLTLGIALAGIMAFRLLPVAPLPQIDFPAIFVSASMPGASPEVMASSVATPLERHLGTIADVTDMTSTSSQNSTSIQLVFGLDRDIDGAARDVQAAIVAARQDLPTNLRSNPVYRKFNGSQAPVIILSMTSETLSQGQIYDAAATDCAAEVVAAGWGRQCAGPGQRPARRPHRTEPHSLVQIRYWAGGCARRACPPPTPTRRRVRSRMTSCISRSTPTTRPTAPTQYKPLIVAYRDGNPVRLKDVAQVLDKQDGAVENIRNFGLLQRPAGDLRRRHPAAGRQHHRHGRPGEGDDPGAGEIYPQHDQPAGGKRPIGHHPRLAETGGAHADGRCVPGHPGGLRLPARLAVDA